MQVLPPVNEMQRAFLASDASYNGVFYTAVRTTGIFCLPACPARKPLPENVEFFVPTTRLQPAEGCPAFDRHLGVGWIDLDAVATPTETFGGNQSRTRAGKRLVHKITASRRVGQTLLDQADRLHGRVAVVTEGLVVLEDARRTVVAIPAAPLMGTPPGSSGH